jgi:hypothetical protein
MRPVETIPGIGRQGNVGRGEFKYGTLDILHKLL